MRALFWFREDLRLEDNPALTALCADADEAVFAFVQPDTAAWSRSPERMGEHRSRFMAESVMALDQALREHGNQLMVLHGDPDVAVVQLWSGIINPILQPFPSEEAFEKKLKEGVDAFLDEANQLKPTKDSSLEEIEAFQRTLEFFENVTPEKKGTRRSGGF